MSRKFLSVWKKLEILKQAKTRGNISTSRISHKALPNQIRNWLKNLRKILAKKQDNFKARQIRSRKIARHSQFDQEVYALIIQQQENALLYLSLQLLVGH